MRAGGAARLPRWSDSGTGWHPKRHRLSLGRTALLETSQECDSTTVEPIGAAVARVSYVARRGDV